MNKFGFIKTEQIINVKIKGKSYPVIKAGKGTPALLIGLGTLSFRTVSKNFANNFEIYSSDLYWIEDNTLEDPHLVTIDTILDDIKALGNALNLTKYIIFAHSAYGIIALEFAKKYPNVASGIIMVGTPVNSNLKVANKHNSIFQKMADKQRKLIDAERRNQIEKEDLTKLTLPQRWLREYVFRDAPRYWHISNFDCSELWNKVVLSKLLTRLFSDILPAVNVLKGLKKVNEPVFLAAGLSDYDCCPWLWKEVPNLPQNFTISIFDNSGHWPHYEESYLFDTRVIEWMEKII
jgi:proline iminopeptidase